MPDGIPFQRQVIDDAGKPVVGALVSAFRHETQTPELTYHDPACLVPTTIPYLSKAGGRVNIYHKPGLAIDFVTRCPETGRIYEFVTIGGAPTAGTSTQEPAETIVAPPVRDEPEAGLQAVLDRAKTAKANIDEALDPVEPEAPYRYSVSFLRGEFDAAQDVDLEATDKRLLLEYEDLHQRRLYLEGDEDARRILLNSKFYSFQG